MVIPLIDSYLIWSNEHAAWWRPNVLGYTPFFEEAGRYSREKAIEHSRGRDQCRGAPPPEIPVREIDMLAAMTAENSDRHDRIGNESINRFAAGLVKTAYRRQRIIIGRFDDHVLRAIPKVTTEDDVVQQWYALRGKQHASKV